MNRGREDLLRPAGPEYDDWYLGTGLFAARVRPGWHAEVEALRDVHAAQLTLSTGAGRGLRTAF